MNKNKKGTDQEIDRLASNLANVFKRARTKEIAEMTPEELKRQEREREQQEEARRWGEEEKKW